MYNQLVAALTNVWDNGANQHPPGYFCRTGDTLTVITCPAIGQILVPFGECGFFVYRHEIAAMPVVAELPATRTTAPH